MFVSDSEYCGFCRRREGRGRRLRSLSALDFSAEILGVESTGFKSSCSEGLGVVFSVSLGAESLCWSFY